MIKTKYLPAAQVLIFGLLVSAIIISLSACTPKEKQNSDLLSLFVSIEPQKYFLERIGGEYIDAEIMVRQGQNPATYEPTPMQIAKLGNSSAFFSIGVPFEKAFLKKISSNLPDMNLIDTSEGIEKRKITDHGHNDHSEDHNEEEQLDPHIWMSPILVKKQARTILTTLIQLQPENADYFTENYNLFISDLNKVDQELEAVLADIKGSTMFVYHPSFGYFADLYGLNQLAIEEAGKEPSPRILETIIKEILKENVKIIFVQPEFQSSSIKIITDATGAAVVSINPLSYDYLDNLRYIARTLKESLQN